MGNKVLVLFAHPSQRRSEVNVPLFDIACSVKGVTAIDLYALYPTYHIDIDREQKRLINHEIIIFQFPLYWYSTPSILKEWQDLVLEFGFAYGAKGNALHEKYFLCAITAGGSKHAYKEDGYNLFKIRELLTPLEQMANLTGMNFLAPYALFGARMAIEENRFEKHKLGYRKLLTGFVDGTLNLNLAATCEKITASNIEFLLR